MSEIIIDTPGVDVRRFTEQHIGGIIELMNKEGWYYYDRRELKRYLTLGQDCFTLLKDGHITGSVFTTNYGDQAWIGNIVVAKEARGRGLATKLVEGVVDRLHRRMFAVRFR